MNHLKPKNDWIAKMQTNTSGSTVITYFDSKRAELGLVGGKGANLAKLVREGFPVPGGFIINTDAYKQFLSENDLSAKIESVLTEVDAKDTDSLENASRQIRLHFTRLEMSSTVKDEILLAYKALQSESETGNAVAVRSSATAEDLQDLSFAGQQDTYLNVIGEGNLLEAVINCWSSLWTSRAIGYRSRNNVDQLQVSLAVVVQKMVQSEASGVLFTANPLTGNRFETIIDATFGLGEALVSGQVEPDHYVISRVTHQIQTRFIGKKATAIHGLSTGGTQIEELDRSSIQALDDDQILALSDLGDKIAILYNFPQDIEWAIADKKIYILQSRPITSLFPIPERIAARPLKVFFSFAAVQGMLDPITPLGMDTLRELFAAGAAIYGIHVTRQTQNVIYNAGERLWINFTKVISNSTGRKILPYVFAMVEPSVRQALEQIVDDPQLQPGRSGISLKARLQIVRFLIPMLFNVFLNMIAPGRRRAYIVNNGENKLQLMEKLIKAINGDRWQRLYLQSDLLKNFGAKYFPATFILFVSGVASGMASWNFLNILADGSGIKQQDDSPESSHELVLNVTRGMPYNPTTEMDLRLWEMAKIIRKDKESVQYFKDYPSQILTNRYQAGDLPYTIKHEVEKFLNYYGGRGLGEIDLGRKRWAEDPQYVFETLANFLKIESMDKAPDVIFAAGSKSAEEAIEKLARQVRMRKNGWLKSRLIRFFARRVRQLMGVRESPKFFAVRLFWLIRQALITTGSEFAAAGDIEEPEDLFFMTFSELKEFANHKDNEWKKLIVARKQEYQHEMLRKQIPRLLLSDGRAFYGGVSSTNQSDQGISGSPVSPGSVSGRVRVVLNPTGAGLLPGEIMVCPGTDPSWTPLFLTAAGLVMEVGGMMTHGAVVAREYGIPAIVGVEQATTRLQTGQLVRIDGSSGQIQILDEESVSN